MFFDHRIRFSVILSPENYGNKTNNESVETLYCLYYNITDKTKPFQIVDIYVPIFSSPNLNITLFFVTGLVISVSQYLRNSGLYINLHVCSSSGVSEHGCQSSLLSSLIK